ncbi:g13457 [Coccomyxa viridis]|uniref:hydroxyacylglutathione hydrolase n=1 Tax=Coccomyxa viridis TaxID=1274662 RepID=A0ABP1GCT3_9CHLO
MCLSTQWTVSQASIAASLATERDDITKLRNLSVQRVPCLSDNYVWILQEAQSGKVAIVDPSEAAPVAEALEQRGLKPDYILNTHHHWDHTGGNLELKDRYKLTIVGPKADEERIPGIDVALADGETWQFGGLTMHVMDTPGHTRGHITLWFPEADALFPGDTLFALGCGRLFEGNAKQMWASLSKMLPLPRTATVFCAHEYTQSNAKFAAALDKSNDKLQQRKEAIDASRQKGEATVPSNLGDEFDTNPFLRPGDVNIRKSLGVPEGASDAEAFAAIRKAKDNA